MPQGDPRGVRACHDGPVDNQLSTGALAVVAASGGAGAFLAGLVAAFVNWHAERQRTRREHQAWLREKKYEAYSTLVASARIVGTYKPEHMTRDNREVVLGTLTTFNDAFYRARLLVDESRAGQFNAAYTAFQSAPPDADQEGLVGAILDVMRDDLGSKRRGTENS